MPHIYFIILLYQERKFYSKFINREYGKQTLLIDQCNWFLHENLQLCMISTGKVFYHCTKTRTENCKFWQWGGEVKC